MLSQLAIFKFLYFSCFLRTIKINFCKNQFAIFILNTQKIMYINQILQMDPSQNAVEVTSAPEVQSAQSLRDGSSQLLQPAPLYETSLQEPNNIINNQNNFLTSEKITNAQYPSVPQPQPPTHCEKFVALNSPVKPAEILAVQCVHPSSYAIQKQEKDIVEEQHGINNGFPMADCECDPAEKPENNPPQDEKIDSFGGQSNLAVQILPKFDATPLAQNSSDANASSVLIVDEQAKNDHIEKMGQIQENQTPAFQSEIIFRPTQAFVEKNGSQILEQHPREVNSQTLNADHNFMKNIVEPNQNKLDSQIMVEIQQIPMINPLLIPSTPIDQALASDEVCTQQIFHQTNLMNEAESIRPNQQIEIIGPALHTQISTPRIEQILQPEPHLLPGIQEGTLRDSAETRPQVFQGILEQAEQEQHLQQNQQERHEVEKKTDLAMVEEPIHQEDLICFATQSPELTDINEIRTLLLKYLPPNLKELTLTLADEQLRQMYLEIRAEEESKMAAHNLELSKRAEKQVVPGLEEEPRIEEPIKSIANTPERLHQNSSNAPAASIEESKHLSSKADPAEADAPKSCKRARKRIVTTVVQQVQYVEESDGESPRKCVVLEDGSLRRKANSKSQMQSILGQICSLVRSLDLSNLNENAS